MTFKKIKGYEKYFISNQGVFKNINYRGTGKTKIASNSIDSNGYPVICSPFRTKIHRLVAEYFIPNPQNKKCVNHINGIKTDNRVENLEWATHSENTIHAYKIGLMSDRNGVNNSQSKLTENQVREIRKIGKSKTQTELSKIYGVAQSKISSILRLESYKNV